VKSRANYRLGKWLEAIGLQLAQRLLSVLGLRHPWIKQQRNPSPARTPDGVRLFAILGTWMEADVIEASVRNALAQGCDRVLLVDNDSPDDTVAVAVAAGAELAGTLSTSTWDDDLRYEAMNDFVARVSADDGSDRIWWLWLDADEFPHGTRGSTVREQLATLDERFRIVGARFFNHYPGAEPHSEPGLHPLDFQPLCEELRRTACWWFHNKHPLQRFDRDRPALRCQRGMHWVRSAERPLFEPSEPIFVHHFPFRQKEATLGRLEALFSAAPKSRARDDDPVAAHALQRLRTAEAVYAGDWAAVGLDLVPRWGWKRPRLEPQPWDELVSAQDARVRRWYG
jgi:hypothetical protein